MGEAPTETPTRAPTETPTQAPTETPTEVPTAAPMVMITVVDDEPKRCDSQPVAVGGTTWGGLGAKISQTQCLNACLSEPSCMYSVCRLKNDDTCMQCSAFRTCNLASYSNKRFAVAMKQHT